MRMMLFVHLYQDLALAEIRSVVLRGHPSLPDDEYGLIEAYCPDPKCDCRRVSLNVMSRRDLEKRKGGFLATISYGFDRDSEFAGPDLDPLNPQSRYAGALLGLVKDVLADPAYVARLERHYHQAKQAASDPDPAVRRAVADFLAEEEAVLNEKRPASSTPRARTKEGRPPEKPDSRDAAQQEDRTIPIAIRPAYEAVVAATDAFCKEHLNEEYAQLSRKLAAAMARKRPSPLAQGKPLVWACGIVYALGGVNFLGDRTQTPHMSTAELCERFGVGKSTGSAKAGIIKNMFGLFQMDPRWTLPSRMERNPLVWMLSVNGVLMDIRYAPRGAQEEALRKGLIPYIPERKGEQP